MVAHTGWTLAVASGLLARDPDLAILHGAQSRVRVTPPGRLSADHLLALSGERRGARPDVALSSDASWMEIPGPTTVWLSPMLVAEAGRRAAAKSGKCRTEERKTGRGERFRAATNDLPISMRLAEPPEPFQLVRSA